MKTKKVKDQAWCFLKIDTTKATFQPLATKPESSDIWKRHIRAGTSSVTAVLRMKEGAAAGHVTFWGSRFFKSLWSPFQSTLLPLSGMVVVKYSFFRENIPFGD